MGYRQSIGGYAVYPARLTYLRLSPSLRLQPRIYVKTPTIRSMSLESPQGSHLPPAP